MLRIMIASKRFFKMIRNLRFLFASPFIVARDGDYPEAFEPELWANESIAILEGNMVAGNLVHRDFEEAIASYGQVVNTRKPSEFLIKRKVRNDSVVVQQPDADNIPVVLNQHLYVTFLVLDVDQTKSFKDLVATYLQPAMLTIAEGIDNIVSGQVYQFLSNNGGQLNMMDSTNAEDYILDARLVMNKNKAYTMNRNLLLGPVAETTALKDDKFTDANRVGDDGTALREASLGRKFGNDIFMAQSQPYIDSTALDVVTGAINQSGGYPVGTKTFTVDGLVAAITAGTWITIAGDNTPLQVVSTVGGATPTSITTVQGIKRAVANDAVDHDLRSRRGGQLLRLHRLDDRRRRMGEGDPLQELHLRAAGRDGSDVRRTDRDLPGDRGRHDQQHDPARPAVGDLDLQQRHHQPPPGGSYNWLFHRNALALVTRPLALPMPGTGVRAGIANYNNLSMRITMTYDSDLQGTKVTVDTLMGVKVLDHNLGAVMLS
jgi:hypothetical protein